MNIYVGNLPFTITEDKLMDLFVGFGEVSSVKLITDAAAGQPRGFGFVEMPTQSEAEAAIKSLNGTLIGGGSSKSTSPVIGDEDEYLHANHNMNGMAAFASVGRVLWH